MFCGEVGEELRLGSGGRTIDWLKRIALVANVANELIYSMCIRGGG